MEQPWADEVERERRFLLDRGQTERFLTAIAAEVSLADHHLSPPPMLAVAASSGPTPAYTRTTYLDTSDGALVRACDEHSAGRAAMARRLRIREYAAGLTPETPARLTGTAFLELKESAGAVRSKRRVAAPPGRLARWVAAGLVAGPGCAPAGRRELAAILHRVSDLSGGRPLAPCLVTWYRRWSFRARVEPIRITLDEGLAYARPPSLEALAASGSRSLVGRPAAPTDVAALGPGRVLEIKLRGPLPEWLARAMIDLPEPARFSKFQSGVRVLARDRSSARPTATRPIAIPRCLAPA